MAQTTSSSRFVEATVVVRAALGDRQREIAWVFALLGATFVTVSLVGFDTMDPTLFDGGGEVSNPCGPLGATLAAGLFAALGLGAWATFGLMVVCVLALAGRPVWHPWTMLNGGGAYLGGLAFFQLVSPSTGAGGAVGRLQVEGLVAVAGTVGAWLTVIATLVATLTVLADVRWGRIAARAVETTERLSPHVRRAGRAGAGHAARAARTGGRWTLQKAWDSAKHATGWAWSTARRMASSLTRTHSSEDTHVFERTDPDELQEMEGGCPSVTGELEHTAVGRPVAVAEVQWVPTEGAGSAVLEMFPELSPRPPSAVSRGPNTVVDGGKATAPGAREHTEETPAVPVAASMGTPTPLPRAFEPPLAPPLASEVAHVPSEPSALDAPPVPRGGVVVHKAANLDAKHRDDGGVVAPQKRSYQLPRLSMLDVVPTQQAVLDQESLRENALTVEETLASFKVTGEVTDVRVGPVVTTFEFLPSRGISVRRIAGLGDDLAMQLKALSVRIVAPIPGKGVVGIETPSARRLTIFLRELLASPAFRENGKMDLPVVLGKDVEGAPVVADLAKMPHLLVGGTTGSGKSVGVNGMLMSLLFRHSPADLRLLLIDPKKLEFKLYEEIPHLLHPVVTEPKAAAVALAWACREMDSRYELLARWDTRNISSYNAKVERESKSWTAEKAARYSPDDWPAHKPLPRPERLPYIVIVIDELADLMLVAKKDVETSIARLAQMARACGIHLIVATQRPSVDVVTGLIKSNLPSRISFKLRTVIDSRTVLDTGGAEALLGRGDLLYLPNAGDLVRCHGAFVSDEEVARVVEFLRAQGEPEYIDAITHEEGKDDLDEDGEQDALYPQAVAVVRAKGKASTSMVQRHLKIGYNRAARIIDQMERLGVVGPADGARPREVLEP
jgi:DNA segregation ATPase FtsK/SpoIIIE, S-DNA-T family